MRKKPPNTHRLRAFTLVEVLVSVTILMIGIISIVSFFPLSMRQNQRAIDTSIAAYLAQMKAEEIRRDNLYYSSGLIFQIELMGQPSAPLTFPGNPRFAYSISGVSLLHDDDGDPTTTNIGDAGIARVIVRYDAKFNPDQTILYELRFN